MRTVLEKGDGVLAVFVREDGGVVEDGGQEVDSGDGDQEEEWLDEVFGGDDYFNANDDDERYYDDISGVELSKNFLCRISVRALTVYGIRPKLAPTFQMCMASHSLVVCNAVWFHWRRRS